MRPKELIRSLTADGWYKDRQAGSHIHFLHPAKPGKIIVPFHTSQEIGKGLKGIF